jgi:hypothetical protein
MMVKAPVTAVSPAKAMGKFETFKKSYTGNPGRPRKESN